MMRLFGRIIAASTVVACAIGICFGDEPYPSRPVHILVPFTAGTNADLVARMYADRLSQRLGQSFVVENRPGAGGVVAAVTLLAAPADGYTVMFVSSAHAVNPSFYKKLPYDTLADFSGVALVGSSPTVLVVSPALGARTQTDFVKLVSANPGKLNFGSAGIGSATHLACQAFLDDAHLDMVHVPYKGVQEILTDLMGGRLQLGCPPVGLAAPQVKAGRLLALSIMSDKRSPLLPDVPTSAEAGLDGADFGIWYGMVASSKTPKPILERLANAVSEVSKEPQLQETMLKQGVVPQFVALTSFDAFIKSDIARFHKMVAEPIASLK